MRKSDYLNSGTSELHANIYRIEGFSRECADMIQKCIDDLIEYRAWLLQHLQVAKEELSATIEAAV
jgi:hypothetical protein